MFLLNSCLGLFSAARSLWRPFSRSYGTILPSSLTALLPSASGSSPHLPVSVCGTGTMRTIAAFLDAHPSLFLTLLQSAHDAPFRRSFAPGRDLHVLRVTIPGHASCACPRSSVAWQGRNLHLLSIGYVFRPRLRPRLPQGRSALPWNPWIFGLKDSYFHLATRSGILSPHTSTRPSDRASSLCRCSPTNVIHSKVSAARFSPGHFRRRASRLVSCYALFE